MLKNIEKTVYVGLIGAGTVGGGVVQLLKQNEHNIAQKAGANIKIKTIVERNPEIVKELKKEGYNITENVDDIINDKEISIVVELIGRIEPAKTIMVRALEAGKYVVTANKDVIAVHGEELFALAQKNNVSVLFEASVGGGIPIIRALTNNLVANDFQSVIGIVNGTTNYMLTKMSEEGVDYAEVLKEAQDKGYAEKDPTADVGGFDAARKIAILSSIAFNCNVSLDDVVVEGIESVSAKDIKYAKAFGYIIKLLAIAKKLPGQGIDIRVHPTFLPKSHPLASVNDVFNAIFLTGDAIGDTMLYGQGAGKMATASAVCGDIIDIVRNIVDGNSNRQLVTYFEEKVICPQKAVKTPFYIRLLVQDRSGVLAGIAAVFGNNEVGLRNVIQKQSSAEGAELVIITHSVSYENLSLAIQTLNTLSTVNEVCTIIRVEDKDFV